MAKNIVICSDGTGNTALKDRGTNVFKLFEAIDLNGHRFQPRLTPQIAFYDDGVGTESFKPMKVFAGATGFGLGRNVRQLYKELCRVYDPGDRIFLFGFSRGAFTVRTLAGLIASCGILDVAPLGSARALEGAVREAYRTYRRRYRTVLAQWMFGPPPAAVTEAFRRRRSLAAPVPIAFLGVWDTVDAVGMPFHLSDVINTVLCRFKFPDRKLNAAVQQACHALAADDERHSFHPLLWEEGEGADRRIEQVWFAGAHSNVGGGYPKHGMSLVALDWMMSKAEAAGLRFLPADRALYRNRANVDDKLYDPRAGMGVFYRWKPRDIAALCRRHGVRPAVHLSVLERIAHGTDDYTPGNLPPEAAVVITPSGDAHEDAALQERADEVQSILRSARHGHGPLLSGVRAALALGHVSYYVYVLSCLLAVLVAAAGLWTSPRLLGALLGGFVASYLMALFTGLRTSGVFSQFWHLRQPDLRGALKRARRQAAEESAPARVA